MAQTRTYADLITLIQARMGASLGATELSRAKALINDRADEAYRRCQYWDNHIVIGEPQTVDNSGNVFIVPYVGASSAAVLSSGNANEGDTDTFYRIHGSARPWHTETPYEFQFTTDGTGARLINYAVIYGQELTPSATENTSSTELVVTISELVDAYVGGTVTLQDYVELDDDPNGTLTVADVSYSGTTTTLTLTVAFGASLNTWLAGIGTIKFPTAFVTYKKRLTLDYGDDTGETSDIPREWFRFIGHAVASDFLRADQQHSTAAREEAKAEEQLKLELARLDAQHANEVLFNRVRTHGTESRSEAVYSNY